MKIRMPAVQVEKDAMQARLQSLGIKVDESGNVDPKSVEQLRAGKLAGQEALQSVLEGGMLTYEATGKLSRAELLGFTAASVSERDTNALKSINMNLKGINQTLEQGIREGFFRVEAGEVRFDGAVLDTLKSRISATEQNWTKTLGKSGLAHVAPEAVIELRETLKDTVTLMGEISVGMSVARSHLLRGKSEAKGFAGVIARPLLNSLIQSLDVLEQLNKFAERSLFASPQVQDAAPVKPVDWHQNEANDVVGGVFSYSGVDALAALFKQLDQETQLGLGTLRSGVEKLISRHFVTLRAGGGYEMMRSTLERLVEGWPKNLDMMEKQATYNGDLYAAIGANRDMDPGDLQRSFRLAAKLYHPDANGERSDPAAFDRAKKAYDKLKDPAARAAYDRENSKAGLPIYFASLLHDPSRKLAELYRDDSVQAALKNEKGVLELVATAARAHPKDGKAFLAALDKVLLDSVGEPRLYSATDLDELGKKRGVLRGDYSPENLGRAVRTALESLDPKEAKGLATRTFARAQKLTEPRGVVDELIFAHDEKFVEAMKALKERHGFTIQGIQGLKPEAQRDALRSFSNALEQGGLPALPGPAAKA